MKAMLIGACLALALFAGAPRSAAKAPTHHHRPAAASRPHTQAHRQPVAAKVRQKAAPPSLHKASTVKARPTRRTIRRTKAPAVHPVPVTVAEAAPEPVAQAPAERLCGGFPCSSRPAPLSNSYLQAIGQAPPPTP